MLAIDIQPSLMCLMMVKNPPHQYATKKDDISDSSGDEDYRSSSRNLFKFFSALSNDVKCPVCFEILNRPLMLSCLHSFCTSCLQEVTNNQSVTCPLCRCVTKLSEKGIDGLPINRDLTNVCESIKKAFEFCPKVCDHCFQKKVTRKCEQCCIFLCKGCCDTLHAKRNSHHTIIISDGSSVDDFDVESHVQIENEFDPPLYLPFNITRKKCTTIFRDWVRSLWFAPSDLNEKLVLRYIKPVYLPYWIFEAHTTTRYGATMSNGNTSIPQLGGTNNINIGKYEKNWVAKTNLFSNKYRQATIANNKLIDRDLLIQVQSWELSNIPSAEVTCPPDPKILTLAYLLDETTAWKKNAEVRIKQKDKELCEERVKSNCPIGSNIKDIFVDTSVTSVASQRVFLPCYFIKYVYNNENFSVIVNAQSSKVVGHRPYAGIGGIFRMFKPS
ncbi:hypothetical protein PPL_05718 [Heterostelium album PN500]|uniref:RING-type domain-containing protein n=1 Tax=Heterostelium pallidum (strain ATCC 26659 / Pp 5 / PN500) TaxID=670386 RepID=D3BAY7_HETP5|nr:hypothetical protein PPL_05718 [Heterostelium album PN500]EFA81724.1 hypothetical protein PPL_05718 [Heterostelium album PN500]|eukprot:XP_020433841.1 hypothetical protein PPL_05718 [Heterostelium album PN500]